MGLGLGLGQEKGRTRLAAVSGRESLSSRPQQVLINLVETGRLLGVGGLCGERESSN